MPMVRILRVVTQMVATEYFYVVLFIMLYKVFLTFTSADEILIVTIEMKANEQYASVAN